jgi:FPC/CPF motif-containing protein YcgG
VLVFCVLQGQRIPRITDFSLSFPEQYRGGFGKNFLGSSKLHELDRAHYDWDESVSRNPQDADFSFSFAETGFFIVGLHKASSRLARRFPWATLVFNTHAQFERLRWQNQFERMQQTVRARDLKLQGSLNPNLSDFGKQSEAKQYSGRAVEENWKCPFHAQMRETRKPEK